MTVTKENTSAQTKEAGNINFTKTLKSLLELLELEEEDDYGILRPTDYAFKTAMNLLVEAYEMMGDRFPKIAHNSTDELGGIRIGWAKENSDRELSLFSPSSSDKQAYIYRQINEDTAVEYEVSVSNLVRWLEWFKGE